MPCALAGAHPRPSGMKVRVGRGMSGRACGRPHSMQSLWTAVETALVGYVREPLCASSCPRAACAQRPSSCSSPHHLARPSSRCRLGFRDLSWPAPRCARRACLRWSASTSDARPCSSWWLARIHLLAVLSIRVATWLRYGQRRGFAWRVMYLAVYPTPRDTRANIDDEWHLAAVVLVQHLLHLRGGQMAKPCEPQYIPRSRRKGSDVRLLSAQGASVRKHFLHQLFDPRICDHRSGSLSSLLSSGEPSSATPTSPTLPGRHPLVASHLPSDPLTPQPEPRKKPTLAFPRDPDGPPANVARCRRQRRLMLRRSMGGNCTSQRLLSTF